MIQGGFAGRVLHVDLTRESIESGPLDFSLAEKYIGGLGLAIRIAYEKIRAGTDALSPGNPIVMGAGPLVGTSIPASSRVYAVTRLPQSRAIGWCGGGGVSFGCNLKNAGYDHVVIEGRADRPVFLKIIDDHVEICDAHSLWGKGVEDTCNALWNDAGRHSGVISIGQAGENLVSFSMAYIDRLSTMGRGGLGAVMGSKNLKGIAVSGTRGIRVADRKKYRELNEELLQNIRSYDYLKEWQELGLLKSLPIVPRDTYDKMKKRRLACVSCPLGDKDMLQIPDGEFKGQVVCSTSAVNLFMPLIYGFKDYREAVKCTAILDEYGLDMFEFFGIMGLAKALCEKGLIKQEQVEHDIDLKSLESMAAWARKVSLRQGLGDVLAGGFERMMQEFGEDAKKYLPPLVKGMFPYVGPTAPLAWRLFGTMELGQALDPRGPHVGASGSPTYFAKRPLEVFPRHLRRMGVPEEAISRIIPHLDSSDREQELKVGALLKYSHSWFATLGSMGICARAQINRFYNASLCAQLYQAVTGIRTDLDDLRKRVDRVWTLLRLANAMEGFKGRQDAIPEQWFKEPAFLDYLTEEPVKPEEVKAMIKDYYREWGWDPETGIPPEDLIDKLEIP